MAGRCRLCAGDVVREYRVREMMLGTREVFLYEECGRCSALQRADLSIDLAPYYPSDYYAYTAAPVSSFAMRVRRIRNWLALSRRSPVRSIVNRIAPPLSAPWANVPGLRSDSRILDVGCGAGLLLRQLAEGGFTDLTGVDPFLPAVVETPPQVRMIRGNLKDVSRQFDYITFHHSLEHIEDQQATMRAAADRLTPGGWLLVRVPTVSSLAWRKYREHWFQIDAPRHFVLHSIQSLKALGEGAGLTMDRVIFDSDEGQFLWSDSYARDISMADHPVFDRAELTRARRESARANARGEGDRVAMYFRKP